MKKLHSTPIFILLLLSCSPSKDNNQPEQEALGISFISDDELNELMMYKEALQRDDSLTNFYDSMRGDFVSKDKLDLATALYDSLADPLSRVTGHLFPEHFFIGKAKMRQLIKLIKHINRNTTDPELKVVGIVVRLGIKTDVLADGTTGTRIEPFLLPVRRNKQVVYSMPNIPPFKGIDESLQGGFGGLDETQPCPDNC